MNSNNYQHITHESIELFINSDSTILILGSFPSVKTRESGFYYGHPMNRFYKVISNIFNEDVPNSIEEKKQLLKKYNIALYDVIYSCDIINSSDSSIKNVTPLDIRLLLSRYPNIKAIILNGNKAKELFNRYLFKDIDTQYIDIYYAPSTSPANAKMGLAELINQYSAAIIRKGE